MARPSQQSGKRRVMQLTWSLVAGGSEMYAWNIVSHLDAQKYSCAMCALDQGGALEAEIAQHQTPYFIMNRQPGIDWRLMIRLYRLFREHRVEVIQTHHFNQLFYSFIGAKLAGIRIIHTEHDTASYPSKRLRQALRFMSRFCHRVVAISDEIAGMLRDEIGIPAEKVQVIRAGINLDKFAPQDSDSRCAARSTLGIDEQARVAVIIARLFPEKNHLLLLHAFSSVVLRQHQAELLIVGEGTERHAIETEIRRLGLENNVRLLGVRRDIPLILAASDVFVLSSDREGLPIAVIEALAAGLPVVATRVGDIESIVRDGLTGHLVAPQNAGELADALVRILESPSTGDMATNARNTAQQYGLPAMLNCYEILYSPQ